MKNKRLIEIISIPDYGRNQNLYCDKVLLLRTARRPGDKECVNNYVIGKLLANGVVFKEVE